MSKKEDVYSDIEPPKLLIPVGIAFGTAVLFLLSWLSDTSLPFFGMLSVGVITMLVGLTWSLRSRPLLWILISIVVVIHVVALWLIRWPSKVSYGVAFAPALLTDILIFWRIIIAVLKVSESRKQ